MIISNAMTSPSDGESAQGCTGVKEQCYRSLQPMAWNKQEEIRTPKCTHDLANNIYLK